MQSIRPPRDSARPRTQATLNPWPLRSALLLLLAFTAPLQAIAGEGPGSAFEAPSRVAAPNNLTQVVSYGGRTITIRMTKETVRGPNFEVLVQNSAGGYDVYTAGEVRTYMGTVDGYPGAIASGILKFDGTLWAQVFFGRGYTWKTLGSSVYEAKGDTVPVYTYPTLDTLSPGQVGSDTYRFEVGVDMDYRYLSLRKDVAECLQATEFSISQLKAVYIRDALLQPALGRVIVRGSQAHCPYDSSTTNLLKILKDEWNANQTTADRDIACLASPAQGGGVAWVGVIGGTNGYSSNGLNKGDGSFNNVLRHEIGHNWGIHDYHAGSPEGKTIMCGNKRGRFAGPSVRSMMIERDEAISHLDNQGRYSTIDIPPYAALDLARVGYGASVTVDVVANDHDANGHSRSLLDFAATSARGGTLSRSIGTGPLGRDEVTYKAPLGLGPAMDTFHYQVVDSSGMRSKGLVMVLFGPQTPSKHWAFESNAEDTGASPQVHGKLQGGAVVDHCDVAVRSGALWLNGSSAWVELDHAAIQDRIDNCTVSLWFKAENLSGRQVLYEEGGVSNGLAIRLNGSVLEARAKSGSNFGDTAVPGIRAGAWNFVAVTFERGNLSLYLNDGTTPDDSAAGSWAIGAHSDPAGIGARNQQDCFGRGNSGDRFHGSIDDVQVFDGEALSGNLVEDLFFQGPSTWFDEGSGLAGVRGEPRLLCSGPLTANRLNTLNLCNGAPSALSVLVIGGARSPLPFLGGSLIPAPHVVSAVPLTSKGGQSFRVPMAPGVPPGVSFWLQWLVFDSAAAQGMAFSNAVRAVTR